MAFAEVILGIDMKSPAMARHTWIAAAARKLYAFPASKSHIVMRNSGDAEVE